nr:glycosyltransferase [Halorhodospira abdelmalekii]
MFRSLSAKPIANSAFTAQLVKNTLNIDGVRVARPIVSPPRTESPRLATSSAHPTDTNDLNLLTVSRLVPRKNIRTCLHAVHALLRSRGIDVHYTVAGVGPDLDSLQSLARNLEIDDVTHFLGEVTDATKDKLLAGADIFLLPSVQTTSPPSVEGYGIAFIEANYHGCPVISGNSGGMPEAVLDRVTGIITDGSPDEVTAAILELLETKLDQQRIRDWAFTHSPHENTDIVNML